MTFSVNNRTLSEFLTPAVFIVPNGSRTNRQTTTTIEVMIKARQIQSKRTCLLYHSLNASKSAIHCTTTIAPMAMHFCLISMPQLLSVSITVLVSCAPVRFATFTDVKKRSYHSLSFTNLTTITYWYFLEMSYVSFAQTEKNLLAEPR